jgi:hypothetical protein
MEIEAAGKDDVGMTLADAIQCLYPYEFKNPKSLRVKIAMDLADQAQKENMNNAKNFDPIAEQIEKIEAQYPDTCGGQVGQGLAGNFAVQPGIRERVAQNLSRAQQEARRTDALHELQHLLEKHPDVARILDLLETAQVLKA